MPCTWVLVHDKPGLFDGRKANELRMTLDLAGKTLSTHLNIARENNELILWDYFSDPDLWQFLEYKRVRAQ